MTNFSLFGALVCGGLMAATLIANGQSKSCADLKTGEYYFYPRNTLQQYHVILSGDQEKVVNMTRRKGSPYYDSSVYKVEWKDNCNYTLKYVEGTGLAVGQAAGKRYDVDAPAVSSCG
jgi:hypothetical protein